MFQSIGYLLDLISIQMLKIHIKEDEISVNIFPQAFNIVSLVQWLELRRKDLMILILQV
jgi:hypothetical protein